MLESMKREEEDFYFSVPRAYKDMTHLGEEINQLTGDLRGGKVSTFAARQDYKDRTKMDAELAKAVDQIKQRVVGKVVARHRTRLFSKTANGVLVPKPAHDESQHSDASFQSEEDFRSSLKPKDARRNGKSRNEKNTTVHFTD
jgi:hypothetical protein